MAEAGVTTVSKALDRLLTASYDAYNAYRAIFGSTCWNDRDRQAFRRLGAALAVAQDAAIANAYASRNRRTHVSLRRRMADRNLPARLSAVRLSAVLHSVPPGDSK